MAIGQGFHGKPSPTLGSLPAGLKWPEKIERTQFLYKHLTKLKQFLPLFSSCLSVYRPQRTYLSLRRHPGKGTQRRVCKFSRSVQVKRQCTRNQAVTQHWGPGRPSKLLPGRTSGHVYKAGQWPRCLAGGMDGIDGCYPVRYTGRGSAARRIPGQYPGCNAPIPGSRCDPLWRGVLPTGCTGLNYAVG